MSDEVSAVLAPHKNEILAQLEAVLRVSAMDNRGVLTSPRRAPATAKQIGDLFFEMLPDAADASQARLERSQQARLERSRKVEKLAADLVQKGLAYETAAKGMQTLRQAVGDISEDDPKIALATLLIFNKFSDQFLGATAAGREALIAREQENYQTSLQDNLRTQIENQKLLAEKLKNHRQRLQAIIDIASTVSTLSDETELINRFVELAPTSLNLAGAAIFELSPDLDAAIVRAAAGRLPKSLDLRQAQPVQAGSSLEQAIDQGDLVLTPLDAAADDLTYQIMAPLKAGNQFSGVLVLWDTQTELTKDDVGFVRPLALLLGGSWQNVRLLAQSEDRARELEMMHGARIQEMWSKSRITTQQTRLERSRKGYIYDGVGVSAEITEQDANSDDALSMPIQIRDFPVGKLIIPASDSNPLGQDDQIFVEAIVREMTGALENANLILDTQRRARREQTIREITEKMRAAVSLEELIQTTAQELGQRFSAEYALVDLGLEQSAEQTSNGSK